MNDANGKYMLWPTWLAIEMVVLGAAGTVGYVVLQVHEASTHPSAAQQREVDHYRAQTDRAIDQITNRQDRIADRQEQIGETQRMLIETQNRIETKIDAIQKKVMQK